IPCYTPGTRIVTDAGPVAVEHLRPGDRVLTRDSGFRPLVWCGRRALSLAEAAAQPAFAPVRIARGALGPGVPSRDLVVSPQHRMLLAGARAEMLFGEHEVLVAALHLVGLPGVTRLPPQAVDYVHVMCERHEVIQAEGAWSESFQPGAAVVGSMAAAARDGLRALFPELAAGRPFPAARRTLKAHEARVLVAA
ncbi:MAG TPA: Hint domain-containing protein, partial [Paracoccaceae bacterium]|nr:Hint domain-containing protein [Paracoccaceae bacterium]